MEGPAPAHATGAGAEDDIARVLEAVFRTCLGCSAEHGGPQGLGRLIREATLLTQLRKPWNKESKLLNWVCKFRLASSTRPIRPSRLRMRSSSDSSCLLLAPNMTGLQLVEAKSEKDRVPRGVFHPMGLVLELDDSSLEGIADVPKLDLVEDFGDVDGKVLGEERAAAKQGAQAVKGDLAGFGVGTLGVAKIVPGLLILICGKGRPADHLSLGVKDALDFDQAALSDLVQGGPAEFVLPLDMPENHPLIAFFKAMVFVLEGVLVDGESGSTNVEI